MSNNTTPDIRELRRRYVTDKLEGYRAVFGRRPEPYQLDIWADQFDRGIAAHDAELREQIAQEIEVPMRRHDNAQIGFSAVGDAYADAARIARGKTGEVKRCLQCGCDLRYPTAVHIVDCGPRKEQA